MLSSSPPGSLVLPAQAASEQVAIVARAHSVPVNLRLVVMVVIRSFVF
jgi:hypothetical protein